MDQVFALGRFVKSIYANGKYLFWAFMDLDRSAWYVADTKSIWSRRKIVESSAEFYEDSRACVRGGDDVREWFPLNVGLRQDCLMSPWLFNVYMDCVVREVNVRVLGKGLELLSANGGWFEINQLLFADDTALVADSKEKLCRLVSEFGRVCERKKLMYVRVKL